MEEGEVDEGDEGDEEEQEVEEQEATKYSCEKPIDHGTCLTPS